MTNVQFNAANCTVTCGSGGGGTGTPDDPFLAQGLAGQWFATGRGPISVNSMDAANLLISNPVGSGVLIQIHRFRIHVTSSSEYVAIRVNPTTNLPVTVVPSSNRRIGYPAGKAIVTMDAGPLMGGGSLLPYSIPVETAGQTFTEFTIIPTITVPPGFSIGTVFENTSGGPSMVVELLDWREVAI